jgi:opacity protein-like surface antigen
MTQAVGALVAIALSSIASTVLAADMPIGRQLSTPAFSWTSCHLGAHAGGGWARESIVDPVQLVQDAIMGPGTTVGLTTVSPSPSGTVIGGQMGCDYQFMSNWVMGMQGAASGSSMKGTAIVALSAGNPGDQALVGTRIVGWVGDKYTVVGTLLSGGFGFEGLDLRTGWTAGGGIEWAFACNWSAILEYDHYSIGHATVLMSDRVNGFTGSLDVNQSVQWSRQA